MYATGIPKQKTIDVYLVHQSFFVVCELSKYLKILIIHKISFFSDSDIEERYALILLVTASDWSVGVVPKENNSANETPNAAAILSTVSTVGFFKVRSICPRCAGVR